MGKPIRLVKGMSPYDVPAVASMYSYNLAFIDGWHNNEQVVFDFEAVLPYLEHASVVVFHDVLYSNLVEGIKVLKSRYVDFEYMNYVGKRYRNLAGTGIFFRGP